MEKVLIVDDSLCFGRALSICKERIEKLTYSFDYIYAVVYAVPENKDMIDIYFEELSLPRVFQWNIFHHLHTSNACVDIDGVLCIDPTNEENDDGVLYENFLLNAKPLFIPTVKIKTLVSCRLEKYREQTEWWLNKHNIEYDNLILLDLPDKETRMKWGKYGEYKANVYLQSGNSFFIESSLKQANTIARITQKPVFCVETFEMIHISQKIQRCIVGRMKAKVKYILEKIIN